MYFLNFILSKYFRLDKLDRFTLLYSWDWPDYWKHYIFARQFVWMSAGWQSCLVMSAAFIATFIPASFRWVYVTLFLIINLPHLYDSFMNSFLRKCGKISYCEIQVTSPREQKCMWMFYFHNNFWWFLSDPFSVSLFLSLSLHYSSMSVPSSRRGGPLV